ncbi:hypothetical protein Y1Q_0003158 [Alligator mississippiensis]|uniref:Uncharacterized protein n=1 Tax=Alligator mississippiensis TaxID=8496 RepID=A0A151MDN8_ALLMI|nr:hypothetical protein Y1Q_0003158 [Alligator mississippiensis]
MYGQNKELKRRIKKLGERGNGWEGMQPDWPFALLSSHACPTHCTAKCLCDGPHVVLSGFLQSFLTAGQLILEPIRGEAILVLILVQEACHMEETEKHCSMNISRIVETQFKAMALPTC